MAYQPGVAGKSEQGTLAGCQVMPADDGLPQSWHSSSSFNGLPEDKLVTWAMVTPFCRT